MLAYATRLPLHWEALPAPLPPAERERLAAEAARLLNAHAALVETRKLADDAEPLALEVERLHLKLDLMMEALALLTHARGPQAATLTLSAESLRWQTLTPPPEGSLGIVRLHLHPALPRPLSLPASVHAFGAGEVLLQFDLPPETGRAELERHVFLQHRREVAQHRQALS